MHHKMIVAAPAHTVAKRSPAVAVKSDVKTGHDIAYVTRGHASGCAGAMAYYTRTGDPPGTWEGRGCAALGVSGTVEAEVAERLYQQGIGPGGERIIQHAAPKSDEDQAAAEAAAIARYREEHPFASASEINAERTRIRATSPGISRPYYDVTSSASKSVSVLHEPARGPAGAKLRRGRGLDAGRPAEPAMMAGVARQAISRVEPGDAACPRAPSRGTPRRHDRRGAFGPGEPVACYLARRGHVAGRARRGRVRWRSAGRRVRRAAVAGRSRQPGGLPFQQAGKPRAGAIRAEQEGRPIGRHGPPGRGGLDPTLPRVEAPLKQLDPHGGVQLVAAPEREALRLGRRWAGHVPGYTGYTYAARGSE